MAKPLKPWSSLSKRRQKRNQSLELPTQASLPRALGGALSEEAGRDHQASITTAQQVPEDPTSNPQATHSASIFLKGLSDLRKSRMAAKPPATDGNVSDTAVSNGPSQIHVTNSGNGGALDQSASSLTAVVAASVSTPGPKPVRVQESPWARAQRSPAASQQPGSSDARDVAIKSPPKTPLKRIAGVVSSPFCYQNHKANETCRMLLS